MNEEDSGRGSDLLAFWGKWKDRFSEKYKTFDYLTWHLLDEESFERIVGGFVSELDRPQAE
jgi:hypothetical protein